MYLFLKGNPSALSSFRLSGHDYEGRGSTVRDDGDLAGHEGDLHRTYSTLDKTSQHRAQGKLKSSSKSTLVTYTLACNKVLIVSNLSELTHCS